MIYTDIGDNELVYLIRSDNQEAKDFLIKRYKKRIFGMIASYCKKNFIKGIDYEDYFHNCFIVFLKCLENFDDEYNFLFYVSQSVEREIYHLIEKEKLIREIIPLEDEFLIKDRVLVDTISDLGVLYRENEINDLIDKNFDRLSKQILNYRLQGYSFKEIADILKISKKRIYKKIDNIRSYLKRKM